MASPEKIAEQHVLRHGGGHDREHEGDRDHRAGVLQHRPGAGGDPAAVGRHGPHHRRGVGRVEHPGADADENEPERALPVGAVAPQRRHRRPARRADTTIPSAASIARAPAVRPDPGQRRGDQHPDRHRRELDPGEDRVVALDALEVEDEHEQQREAREAVDERGRRRGREQPVAEDRQVEHRRAAAAARSARRAAAARRPAIRPAITSGVGPARDAALGDAEHEAGEADRRTSIVPSRSRPRSASRLRELAQDERAPERAGEAERDVEPEHPVPARSRPARRRAPGRSPARPRRPSCSCPSPARAARAGNASVTSAAEFANRKAPPTPWRIRQRISSVPLAGEAGAERGEREDDEAADVGLLAPEQVREPPRGEHQHGRGDHVGEDHPDELSRLVCRGRARGRAGR